MPGPRVNDDHVRALLDQRAQRADVPQPPTRFSIFSDRSDSPSLYSHFDNSRTTSHSTPVTRFPRLNDSDDYNDRHGLYPPLSPKERLADPNASSLDLSEDTDAYSESGSRVVVDRDDPSNLVPDEDEDPETRLSLMGPKMRVHSRAPWEEDDGSISDPDSDGGNDNTSIFGGGKRAGLMRGFGFGSRSPAPRPSFDLSLQSKDKRSFDTVSSASNTSRTAIQTLAQASISSTSLALTPAPRSKAVSHKISTGRLGMSRDRSASGHSNASEMSSNYLPLSSPRSAVHAERPSGRETPASSRHRQDSVSPNRPEFTPSIVRTRSPSPIPFPERDGTYTHPYANPALLSTSAYRHGPGRNSYEKDEEDTGSCRPQFARNDSVATLAASEETVTVTHSSSTVSASVTSTSGMETTTPPTSDFSLVSSASKAEDFKSEEKSYETQRTDRQQTWAKRETKLGAISGPSLISHNDLGIGVPQNLISLEQAQARIRERNWNATAGAIPFSTVVQDENVQSDFTPRARSTSASGNTKPGSLLVVESHRLGGDDMQSSPSPAALRQSNPGGKTLRNKRSGLMKLFSGKDKDKVPEVPPLPTTAIHTSHFDYGGAPSISQHPKNSSHRVPVPTMPSSPTPANDRNDSRSKKTGPTLSIMVSSPPKSRAVDHLTSTRRSDSPKNLQPPSSPRLPNSAPADMSQFPALKLRPVSTFFSKNFAEHLLADGHRPESPRNEVPSLISPTTVASSDLIPSPVNAGFSLDSTADCTASGEDPSAVISALKDQIRSSRINWQRQIWELEGQIRDLRAEIDDLTSGDVCEVCGRGGPRANERKGSNSGVIHRPRAKTGYGARFANHNDG